MQMAVTFRHMEADEGIKNYVNGKVRKLQKYIENPMEVHVVLSVEKFRHLAEVTIVGNDGNFNSQGKDNDLYKAIDQMVEKMERQLRERRGKMRRKRSEIHPSQISPQKEKRTPEEEDEAPYPVAKKHTLAKPMSLEEAISQLDLSKRDFFIFLNSDTGQINVVCHSKDGGYEWVEPRPK